MAGENPVIDITEHPAVPGQFADVTGRNPEVHLIVGDFPTNVPAPGFVGAQLDDRPSPTTVSLYLSETETPPTDFGTPLEIIPSGTPNASQVRLYELRGWTQLHADNLGKYLVAVYDSRGSNASVRNMRRLVEELALESLGVGELANLNARLDETTIVDAINSLDDIVVGVEAQALRAAAIAVIRDVGDTDHDLEFTFLYSDATTSTITKLGDATWAAGDNAGGMFSGDSLPTSGYVAAWYVRSPAGVDDIVLRGNTLTAPTLSGDLAGYTFRSPYPVWLSRTDASANLRAFTHWVKQGVVSVDDLTDRDVVVTDQGTSDVTRTATNIPPGVDGIGRVTVSHASTSYVTIRTTSEAVIDPGTDGFADVACFATIAEVGQVHVPLDDSGQFVTDASAASTTLRIAFQRYRMRQYL